VCLEAAGRACCGAGHHSNLCAHTMLERKTVHILIESRESMNLSDVLG
jgi:hypothetical protein